jgi:hypothetical protein
MVVLMFATLLAILGFLMVVSGENGADHRR